MHKDDYNYYNTFQINLNFTLPLNQFFELNISANIEKQKSAKNNTEFSIFYRDTKFDKNIEIKNYWNNYFSILMDFKTNYNYAINQSVISKGKSFTNINAEYALWNDKFNSTENLYSFEMNLQSYYEFYNPLRLEVNANYYKIKKSDYIQKYRFSSSYNSLNEKENPLTFTSIGNYYFTFNNYLYVDSYLNLIDIPKILNFRPSIGTFITAVKSFEKPSAFVDQVLNEDLLYEYGIGIKEISFFNFYFGLNNIKTKNIFVKMDFAL